MFGCFWQKFTRPNGGCHSPLLVCVLWGSIRPLQRFIMAIRHRPGMRKEGKGLFYFDCRIYFLFLTYLCSSYLRVPDLIIGILNQKLKLEMIWSHLLKDLQLKLGPYRLFLKLLFLCLTLFYFKSQRAVLLYFTLLYLIKNFFFLYYPFLPHAILHI